MAKWKLTKIKFKILTLGVVFIGLMLMETRAVHVGPAGIPSPVEQIKTEEKVIALTINVDWGEEFIPAILDTLDDYQAKATFFVTGRWAQKNPEILKTIAARGHLLENHGYSHPHPDKITVAENKEEISRTETIIFDLTGKRTVFYAPPYGERGTNGLRAASDLGYVTVLWTLDTIDWRSDSTPALITQRILDPKIRYGVKPDHKGAIILMHPKENSSKALPAILKGLQDNGFRFVTMEKLVTYEKTAE
ncbi:polysaccharide deacetylase family protein [Dehalobacter sp. DCM]|uniref:polysaccharide deacetylase family protein n=1 Tax=Dehalobacter sp. DCM TaxID=2907827 RepID=UPI00308175F4|nr:polysaccharide deacetylase family protein [Dehalobacter sp. DCM]